MESPRYFKSIQTNASKRWDQLERDPESASLWHHMFRQVQKLGHVVSELLQNADDAGATEAAVDIDNSEFIFSHNGEDFGKQQFASLCRFGFSNKRTLHTIGFRGVGFKSTFSLGDEVCLITPTLSVAFHKRRFTEPRWIESTETTGGRTEVRVVIQDERRQQELKRNLQEWSQSPASLLFFKNIRCLRIHEQEIRWESQGSGPIDGSEWMSVSTTSDKQYLIIRSPREEFPEEALEEIKDELMTSTEADDDTTFPPYRVEIVLGMEGRLFVVLPTGVMTQLPFACNAPFIQDPARMEIKDPAMSPTNRWLLRKAGELAGDAMLTWLNQRHLPIKERCQAYGLLPDVIDEDKSLEGICGNAIKKGFKTRTDLSAFLLTETRTLELSGKSLAVPYELLNVWPPPQVSAIFSEGRLPILSRHISNRDRNKLSNLGHVKKLSKPHVIETLEKSCVPRPKHWKQLLHLWDYVSSEIPRRTEYEYRWFNNSLRIVSIQGKDENNMRIVPVQGEDNLYAANKVVQLGERQTLKSTDRKFLTTFLRVLHPNWIRWLKQQRQIAKSKSDDSLAEQVDSVFRNMGLLGFGKATEASRIMDQIICIEIQDHIRLAHIAARLKAKVPDKFKFVTQERQIVQGVQGPILVDIDSDLKKFVNADWYTCNVLHDDYAEHSNTCTNDEWRQWVCSPDSHLCTFIPILPTDIQITGRERLREILRQRGFIEEPNLSSYKSDDFLIRDWDFSSNHWAHWKSLAQGNAYFWSILLTRISEQSDSYWSDATTVKVFHISKRGNAKLVTKDSSLVPEWIARFRSLPCLLDTWGAACQPAELFRRTPETEPLQDIKPFVKEELDTEDIWPLLDLLGVRNTQTGPEPLIERLRTLAGTNPPIIPQVQKWCHSLDQLSNSCSTEEIEEIREAFADNRLILTDQNDWARSDEVFLSPDVDLVPEAALIHSSLHYLALWHKIGVAEQPSVDQMIAWLKGLSSGEKPAPSELKRVSLLLSSRFQDRIWDECCHWLNLDREWVSISSLDYFLTMQPLVPRKYLFPAVRARTADFQMLSLETCQSSPFSTLSRLDDLIEERAQGQLRITNSSKKKEWLTALGEGLQRIVLEDISQQKRIRKLAHQLAQTQWQVAGGLESVPYIDGIPAGPSRSIEALWLDNLLYVQNDSPAKMAKAVFQEIGKAFNLLSIVEAVKVCYDRDAKFINEYLEDDFNLALVEEIDFVGPSDELTIKKKQPPTTDVLHTVETNDVDANDVDILETVITDEEINRESSAKGDRKQQSRHIRPSLMERFAQARGFSHEQGTDKFCHIDGRYLKKTQRAAFPWSLWSVTGAIVQYYWCKEHCIQQKPLQLEAEIWSLCEKFPELYSLILVDSHGMPTEISGNRLAEMQAQEELVLYPATYRLQYRERAS